MTKTILAILSLAFATALIVTGLTGHLASPEKWEYSRIAENILKGEGAFCDYLGTRYHFYGSTVYSYFLAATLKATPNGMAMVVIQALFFSGTCFVLYRTASLFFGKTEATLAALLAALHPGNLIYIGKLHSQTLDVFLIALSFLLLARITLTKPTPIRAVMTGLVIGLAGLSRGTVIPFLLLWMVWFVWKERKRFGAVRVAVALTLGGMIAVSPVLVRGYLLYGEVVPLRTDTGINLWYGNHTGASGTSYTLSPSPVAVTSQMPPELSARIVGENELVQNRIFAAAVLDFVRKDPEGAFLLFLKKLYYFWWASPHTGLLYPPGWKTAYLIYYASLLCLGGAGLLAALRSPKPPERTGAFLFLLLAGTVSILQAVFYVEGRHRWQLEVLLLVFSAAGLLKTLKFLKGTATGKKSIGKNRVDEGDAP